MNQTRTLQYMYMARQNICAQKTTSTYQSVTLESIPRLEGRRSVAKGMKKLTAVRMRTLATRQGLVQKSFLKGLDMLVATTTPIQRKLVNMNSVEDNSPPELIMNNTVDVSVLNKSLQLFMLVDVVEVLSFQGLHYEYLAYQLDEEQAQHGEEVECREERCRWREFAQTITRFSHAQGDEYGAHYEQIDVQVLPFSQLLIMYIQNYQGGELHKRKLAQHFECLEVARQ